MTPLQFVQCRKRSRASVIEQRAEALAFKSAAVGVADEGGGEARERVHGAFRSGRALNGKSPCAS
jgi:hypothetical protein